MATEVEHWSRASCTRPEQLEGQPVAGRFDAKREKNRDSAAHRRAHEVVVGYPTELQRIRPVGAYTSLGSSMLTGA